MRHPDQIVMKRQEVKVVRTRWRFQPRIGQRLGSILQALMEVPAEAKIVDEECSDDDDGDGTVYVFELEKSVE